MTHKYLLYWLINIFHSKMRCISLIFGMRHIKSAKFRCGKIFYERRDTMFIYLFIISIILSADRFKGCNDKVNVIGRGMLLDIRNASWAIFLRWWDFKTFFIRKSDIRFDYVFDLLWIRYTLYLLRLRSVELMKFCSGLFMLMGNEHIGN